MADMDLEYEYWEYENTSHSNGNTKEKYLKIGVYFSSQELLQYWILTGKI